MGLWWYSSNAFSNETQLLGIERSSLPSKNFPCISMEMLQIGALVLLGRLVEAGGDMLFRPPLVALNVQFALY